MEEGAIAGAEEAAAAGGIHVFTEEEAWDVLEDIPNDSAAALILIEHHWAVPLRDAIARAGGFRLSDGFISRWTWSQGRSPPRRRSNCMSWKSAAAAARHEHDITSARETGGLRCSEDAE